MLTQENILLLARVLGLLVAIPFHELAHGFVSDKLGDHTAREMGRLTMNPIKHLDVMGLVSMLVIGVGWAKPVPVNPRAYKNPKSGMALTAAAGPIANLLLAFLGMIAYKVTGYSGTLLLHNNPESGAVLWLSVFSNLFFYFTYINISLAIFNMIPVPPLDGSRIFALVLPDRIYFGIMRYERYILGVLLIGMFLLPRLTGLDPLGWLLNTVGTAVFGGMRWLTGFIDAIFGLLI